MHFHVYSHIKPDFDAWGSAAAVFTAIRASGHSVEMIMDTTAGMTLGVSEMLDLLGITPVSAPTAHADVAFVVDCGDTTRICTSWDNVRSGADKVVWIDHHGTNPTGDEVVVDKFACSASQLVFAYLVEHFDVSQFTAMAAALGFIGDSLGFSKASPRDLSWFRSIAAHLDTSDLARVWDWYKMVDPKAKRFRAWALGRAAGQSINVGWVAFDQADFDRFGVDKAAMAGLPAEVMDVTNTNVAFTLSPDKISGEFDCWRISFRSKPGSKVRAIDLAKKFNGAGHDDAAGGSLPRADWATADDAAHYLLAVIEEMAK